MPLSALQKRERRAAKRATEADDATRGQRKPPGGEPTGCYWDPRPGEPTCTWRKLDMHEAYDPAARETARNAARRHATGARATRVHRAEPIPRLLFGVHYAQHICRYSLTRDQSG